MIFVSTSGEATGTWPNLVSPNKIYSYNIQTGQLIKMYEENENRLLRTMGLDGTKLIVMFDLIDTSPGPCFSPWVDWKDFGFLDVTNPSNTLSTYVVPSYQIEKARDEQKQCETALPATQPANDAAIKTTSPETIVVDDALRTMYVGNVDKASAFGDGFPSRGDETLLKKYGTYSYEIVRNPEIAKMISDLTGTSVEEAQRLFGTEQSVTVEFFFGRDEAIIFSGCTPHDCDYKNTAIFIPDYLGAETGQGHDALFLAKDVPGGKMTLHNVSGSDEASKSLKDLLLFFQLNNQEAINKAILAPARNQQRAP